MGDNAVRDLRELLQDPQPGLRTWHLALLGAMSDFGFVSEARLQKVEAQRDDLQARYDSLAEVYDRVLVSLNHCLDERDKRHLAEVAIGSRVPDAARSDQHGV